MKKVIVALTLVALFVFTSGGAFAYDKPIYEDDRADDADTEELNVQGDDHPWGGDEGSLDYAAVISQVDRSAFECGFWSFDSMVTHLISKFLKDSDGSNKLHHRQDKHIDVRKPAANKGVSSDNFTISNRRVQK